MKNLQYNIKDIIFNLSIDDKLYLNDFYSKYTFKHYKISKIKNIQLKEKLVSFNISLMHLKVYLDYYTTNDNFPICTICNIGVCKIYCNKIYDTCTDKKCILANKTLKRKQTNLEKYGFENYVNTKKAQQTCLKNHGVPFGWNGTTQKRTNLEKYGFEVATKSKAVKTKIKETHNKKPTNEINAAKEKRKQTNIIKYNTLNTFNIPARKVTMLERHGVEYNMQNPEIHEKAQLNFKKAYTKKSYILNNKQYYVQGYEPQCLDYLLNVEKINSEDILLSNKDGKPSIKYFDSATQTNKIYHPDIFIKSQNRIIEVKSEYTYKLELENINDKIKGCIDNAYLANVYIMNHLGNLITII